MKREEIKEIVIIAIVELTGFGYTDIEESNKFRDDLTMDSLDHIELTMDLENELNISINDSEVEKIDTVKELIDYLDNVINK